VEEALDRKISFRIYIVLIASLALLAGISLFLPQGEIGLSLPRAPLPAPLPVLALANAGIILAIYGGLGLIGLMLARKLGLPGIWDRTLSNRRRFVLPALVGAGLGIVLIVASILVATIIAYNGLKLFLENLSFLLGRSPGPKYLGRLESLARSVPGVVGVHDLRAEIHRLETVHAGCVEVRPGITIEDRTYPKGGRREGPSGSPTRLLRHPSGAGRPRANLSPREAPPTSPLVSVLVPAECREYGHRLERDLAGQLVRIGCHKISVHRLQKGR
jgi:hypothetical protein